MNCEICGKTCSGIESYNQHVSSQKHLKKVKLNESMSDHNQSIPLSRNSIASTSQVDNQISDPNLSHSPEDEKPILSHIFDKKYNSVPDSENQTISSETSIKAKQVVNLSYAQCEICNKSFTGPQSLNEHVQSKAHQKKLALHSQEQVSENKISIVPPLAKDDQESNSILSNNSLTNFYAKCEVCLKFFTGFESLNDHLISKAHQKKVILNGQESASKDKIITMGSLLKVDKKINPILSENSLLVPSYAECKICQKKFSGPESLNEHLVSKAHLKKESLHNQEQVSENKILAIPSLDTEDQEPNPILSNNSLTTPFYAKCEVCIMFFNGLESLNEHLASKDHQAKLILNPKESVSENEVIKMGSLANVDPLQKVACPSSDNFTIPSYAECKVCQKKFSGPESLNEHVTSKSHQKKMALFEHKSGNITTDELVNKLKNLNIQQGNSDKMWYCQTCQKQCSGPLPYQDHVKSNAHNKQLKKIQLEAMINNEIK